MAINNQFIRTYDDDPRMVMLKRVRLSFTESLKEKKATVENGRPKHTNNVIIEHDQPGFAEKKAAALAAVEAACEEKWKNKDKYKRIFEDAPKRVSYRPGERFRNSEDEIYQGYEKNMIISGAGPRAGEQRPALFNRKKWKLGAPGQENTFTIDDIPEIFAGGYYADVKVSFYGTDKGGDGVFATIESIRSLEEGERMGGGGVHTSADEFDDAEDAFDGSGSSGSSDDDENPFG